MGVLDVLRQVDPFAERVLVLVGGLFARALSTDRVVQTLYIHIALIFQWTRVHHPCKVRILHYI